MTYRLLFLALALGSTAVGLHAQQPKFPVWKAELPGGEYVVRLTAVNSVSLHRYTVDGTLDVTEMTIATNTNVTARFYHIEPKTPSGPGGAGDSVIRTVKDRAQQAIEKASQTLASTLTTEVVKNYPVTTHAHTVEYRLPTADALQAAFDSARSAWLTNRPGSYQVEEE